jgi:hypothetical protein
VSTEKTHTGSEKLQTCAAAPSIEQAKDVLVAAAWNLRRFEMGDLLERIRAFNDAMDALIAAASSKVDTSR